MPNPFVGQTSLRINLVKESEVSVTVYDLSGKQMLEVNNGRSYAAGTHDLALDLASFQPGTYLCVVQQNGQRETLKLVKTQ